MTTKNPSISASVSSQLATPNDLLDSARKPVITAVNPLIADAFALYVKTKNFHWHVSGSHFRDYHLLLDEQAEQVFAMIDILAERVRKLGGTTIRSIGQISQLQLINDDNDEFVAAKDMLWRLLEDNKSYLSRLRAVHVICENSNDVATASILENFIDETERRIWFLFETHVD